MAAAKGEASISIPPINLQRIVVTLRGTSPLLCDRFSEAAQKKIEDKQTGAARRPNAPRDPEAEWRSKLYVIDEQAERYGFPGPGVRAALVGAGRFADVPMTRLRGVFNVEEELIEVRGAKPKLHRTMGRPKRGGGMIPVYRAVFDPWEMDVRFVFNGDLITPSEIVNLVQIAGFAIGLGPWRPEKNGTFGQFVPADFTELEPPARVAV